MITEKEFAEYSSLCSTLDSLHQTFLKRRTELRKLLEKTVEKKREALLILAKANRITRHLNGYQRQTTGLSYQLIDIKARLNGLTPVFQKNNIEEAEGRGDIQLRFNSPECISRRELKQNSLTVISLIDTVKKQILQLELLALRCRELISSINKALEGFRHEERIIRRKMYPFGVFSFLRRSLRHLAGSSYFSYRDMNDVTALGNMTGLILRMADSPLI